MRVDGQRLAGRDIVVVDGEIVIVAGARARSGRCRPAGRQGRSRPRSRPTARACRRAPGRAPASRRGPPVEQRHAERRRSTRPDLGMRRVMFDQQSARRRSHASPERPTSAGSPLRRTDRQRSASRHRVPGRRRRRPSLACDGARPAPCGVAGRVGRIARGRRPVGACRMPVARGRRSRRPARRHGLGGDRRPVADRPVQAPARSGSRRRTLPESASAPAEVARSGAPREPASIVTSPLRAEQA